MADLPILLALLAVAWSAWRRPWVGVLGLVFVGVMNPQSYATGWLRSAPAYLTLGVVVALCTARQFIIERRMPTLFWDWRFAVAGLLAVHMVLTTCWASSRGSAGASWPASRRWFPCWCWWSC